MSRLRLGMLRKNGKNFNELFSWYLLYTVQNNFFERSTCFARFACYKSQHPVVLSCRQTSSPSKPLFSKSCLFPMSVRRCRLIVWSPRHLNLLPRRRPLLHHHRRRSPAPHLARSRTPAAAPRSQPESHPHAERRTQNVLHGSRCLDPNVA